MDSPTDFPANFARVVVERMKASGFSDSEFATAANIPRETLRRRLRGESFKANEMAAVAAALGTTITELARAAEGRTAA